MQQLISEQTALEMYEEMLNDCNTVTIGSLTFDAATVLRSVDPIAFRVGFSEYMDLLSEDDIFVKGYTEGEMEIE